MAHKLAAEVAERHHTGDNGSADEGGKGLLNRREYVKLSASAISVALGMGIGTGSARAGDTFTTDFSEYSA